jgi:hypothetical protein
MTDRPTYTEARYTGSQTTLTHPSPYNMAAERHAAFTITNIYGKTSQCNMAVARHATPTITSLQGVTHTSQYNMADTTTVPTYTQKNSKLSTHSHDAFFRMEWIQPAS